MPVMAYGDGKPYQRKSGIHAGRWEIKRRVDGKWRTATFDRKPTRAMVQAAEARLSNTSPPQTAGDTLGEFLERWLEDGTRHLRSRTVRGYRTLVEGSIVPHLGGLRLSVLSTPAVQRWVNDGASHHALAVLRAALSEAVRWGELTANPARGVRLPKREPKLPQVLSPADTARLLEQVKGDPLEALFVLAVFTGMRQGEILGLRWQDIEGDKLTVAASLWWMPEPGQKRRRPVLTIPKTKRSRRTLTLHPLVVQKLTEHRKAQLRDKPSKDGLVFATPTGHALHPTWVYDELRRHEKAAGLPLTTFHALRHSAATGFISAGVPIPTVSEILGHSTVSTTLNVYSHAIENSQRDAADRMAALLGVVSETG